MGWSISHGLIFLGFAWQRRPLGKATETTAAGRLGHLLRVRVASTRHRLVVQVTAVREPDPLSFPTTQSSMRAISHIATGLVAH
jgi:hypothetical protein